MGCFQTSPIHLLLLACTKPQESSSEAIPGMVSEPAFRTSVSSTFGSGPKGQSLGPQAGACGLWCHRLLCGTTNCTLGTVQCAPCCKFAAWGSKFPARISQYQKKKKHWVKSSVHWTKWRLCPPVRCPGCHLHPGFFSMLETRRSWTRAVCLH